MIENVNIEELKQFVTCNALNCKECIISKKYPNICDQNQSFVFVESMARELLAYRQALPEDAEPVLVAITKLDELGYHVVAEQALAALSRLSAAKREQTCTCTQTIFLSDRNEYANCHKSIAAEGELNGN